MKLIKRFVSYYRPHRRLFIIDMLCALAVAVADLCYPMITKNIINDYVPNQNLRLLLVWAAVLLGIYLVKCLLNYVIAYYGHTVGVRMQADMRRDLFDHLEKLPFSYFDENNSGALMSRLTNDLFEVSELLPVFLSPEEQPVRRSAAISAAIVIFLWAGSEKLWSVPVFFAHLKVTAARPLRERDSTKPAAAAVIAEIFPESSENNAVCISK